MPASSSTTEILSLLQPTTSRPIATCIAQDTSSTRNPHILVQSEVHCDATAITPPNQGPADPGPLDPGPAPSSSNLPSDPIPTISNPLLPSLHSDNPNETPHSPIALPPPSTSSLPTDVPQFSHSHSMVTRTKDRTLRPRKFPEFVALHSISEAEPTNFMQANKLPHWRVAMAEEIHALATNRTWTLIPPPSNQKVIGNKWVYKVKRHSDGTIKRHKARLVAKGYNQEQGVDFEETYSPVIQATTIRVILSLAVSSNWPIKQLDVSNAFLNGELTETVYMTQP